MQNLNICWIDNGDILGGAELFSIDIMKSLYSFPSHLEELEIEKINIDIYSHSIQKNNAFAQKVENIITQNAYINKNITIHHKTLFLPSLKPITFQNIKKCIHSVLQLKKIVNENSYNIVYANTVRAGIITGLAQFFFPKSTKTIFMAHDYTFPSLLAKYIIPRFSQVLSCSYGVKQKLLETGIKSWKIEVIQNGVDTKELANIPTITAPLFKIGIIGRISEWKGQMTVLKTALWLKENAKEYPFTFTFYGEPSNKMEDLIFEKKLHTFVKNNNLQSLITFAGFTPLHTALENSNIIIHASKENEPFGRVPIETAGSGRILCVSNIGTPSEIFTDKENAFFFEAGNSENLAHTLVIIAHNKDKALHVAETGQKLVREKFNLKKISKHFWGFFK